MGRFTLRDLRERQQIARSIVEPLVKGKRDRTVQSLYERLRPGPDGRIHTAHSPIGTTTFRFNSGESLLFEASTNLQNLTNKIAKLDPLYQARDVVVADEGCVLVAGDYKGAEALLVFAYSDDWAYVQRLLDGADIHTEHAQHFFDVERPTVLQRRVAKDTTYASFYHATPFTITERLNKDADITGVRLTIEEVTRLHAVLLQLHPLERWWVDTMELLEKQHGVLRNCFGYRRCFHDPNVDYRLKDGLAFFPQSTVAWLINQVLLSSPPILALHPAREWLLQVHDEHVWQTAPDDVNALIQALTPLYERKFSIHGRELYIPVEWKVARTWGSMKPHQLAA